MATITPKSADSNTITVKTKTHTNKEVRNDWWNASSNKDLAQALVGTVSVLKEQNQYRYRQASVYARLYGNMPLFGWLGGSSMSKVSGPNNLPIDRPTMSVITSCIDTLVSRIVQSKPRPIFLTDNADYKERSLAKQLNQFIAGEFFQTKAYHQGELVLRDACVLGTGALKILEGEDKRVTLERRLVTELLVDPNDSMYGSPRQFFEIKLVDREVAYAMFPKYAALIEKAEQAFPDAGEDSVKTISDQIMLAEGFHLKSGPDGTDGMHAIACSAGLMFDEKWEKKTFPYALLPFSPRMLGLWGQGLSEQLMGTQMEINKLLMTISQSINLVGVPRVFVEDGSKVVKAHLNNQVGSIVTYRGTKPAYEVAPCVPQELYAQLERLVGYAYQQSGVSAMSAASQKPKGLNSGAAIREYDDLQTDRFASIEKRYEAFYVELAYQVIDKAKDICERDGSYQTVFPDKNGTKQIDLPAADLLDDPFVIQCYDVSSLPRDPAGRLEKVTEMMQSGIVSPQEGRRLLGYPDIDQEDKLANAAEERILKILDEIVEDGEFTPPDPFMDLALAEIKVTQYYNLYMAANLEEDKAQMLRDFFAQIQALKAASMPPPMPTAVVPQALPEALPQNPMIPNVPVGQ